MKIKEYTVRGFLKWCDSIGFQDLVFYYKDQEPRVRMPSVQYYMRFSSVKPVTQTAQNGIKLFDKNGNYLTINNIIKVDVGEPIPGFGIPIKVTCSNGIIHSTSNHYCYELILR